MAPTGRGRVIDIFPAESEREAVRVELFDDQIESLAYFDPLTGEVLRNVPRLTIYPKTHYVTPREAWCSRRSIPSAGPALRLDELRRANKLVEAQRLEQRTLYDVEMMGTRLLQWHRELQRAICRAASRASRRPACSITCRTMRC
jgi:excinuclease ABC subunit B